jgi:hypothetical protein
MKKVLFSLFITLFVSQIALSKEFLDFDRSNSFVSQNQQSLFEENKGQVTGDDASKVKFVYKANNLSVFLLKTGIAYQFSKMWINR